MVYGDGKQWHRVIEHKGFNIIYFYSRNREDGQNHSFSCLKTHRAKHAFALLLTSTPSRLKYFLYILSSRTAYTSLVNLLQVSWMRKRDLHILTSGIHTYTGDARFSVRHPEHSDDWDLRIEYVQKRDAGVYECQVNTEPKINLAIMLNVEGEF